MDLRGLSDFYESPMGERTRRLILRRIREIWPNTRGRRLLGYGFTQPYLGGFLGEAERCIAALPAALSPGVAWPGGKALTTLVEEDALPFPDAFFDLVLVAHGLEEAEALRPLLRQLWRVLAPEGKVLISSIDLSNGQLPTDATIWYRPA